MSERVSFFLWLCLCSFFSPPTVGQLVNQAKGVSVGQTGTDQAKPVSASASADDGDGMCACSTLIRQGMQMIKGPRVLQSNVGLYVYSFKGRECMCTPRRK